MFVRDTVPEYLDADNFRKMDTPVAESLDLYAWIISKEGAPDQDHIIRGRSASRTRKAHMPPLKFGQLGHCRIVQHPVENLQLGDRSPSILLNQGSYSRTAAGISS